MGKIKNNRSHYLSRNKLNSINEPIKYSKDRSKYFYLDNEGYLNWRSCKKKANKMDKERHIYLNKLWKGKECHRCGRSYPETLLNIEGVIHHNSKANCLDKKECRRAQRNNK